MPENTAPRRSWKQILWSWTWKLGLGFALLLAAVLFYLHTEVQKHFLGAEWTEPVSVYGRPLSLSLQQPLRAADLKLELLTLGYRQTDDAQMTGEFSAHAEGFRIRARAVQTPELSLPARLLEIRLQDGQIIGLRENGAAVRDATLDPALIGRYSPQGDEDRELVRLSEVPLALQKALVATEDERFYSHGGVSVWAILRASWANFQEGETVQGASTLTQQLVKNLYLSNERSWWRKIREGLMAIVVDWNYSKEQILAAYLNEIFLGQDGARAVHGVGLGARYYFGKPVQELDLAESALLVGIIRGPSYYSPWKHPERALQRRNHVLNRLVKTGEISPEIAERWQQKPLGVRSSARALDGKTPALLDWTKRELSARFGLRETASSALRVYTSFDPVLQKKAEAVLARALNRLDKKGKLEGAIVITDRHSGALRALVSGRDARLPGFNRALDARRAVGSTLKPFLYYTALQRPEQFSLQTPLQDASFVMHAKGGKSWQPKNYDGQEHGNVSLQSALAQSLNLATARMTMEIGLGEMEKTLRVFGLKRDIELWPSLALGALELSPLELATLYSGFANGKLRTAPHALTVVQAPDRVLQGAPVERARIDADAAFLTNWAMQAVVREGTGKALAARFPGLGLAGKTGTTNDARDAWFAGYDDQHLIVVWLGRDDNKPIHLTGASGALPVFSDLLAAKPAQAVELQQPEGVRFAWLSPFDGQARLQECDDAVYAPALESTPLNESCEQ